MGHVPAVVGVIEYEAGWSDPAVGTTVSIRREPAIDPEKCAGGAGSIETGPTSMRYVPSTSKVSSPRRVGRGNWPWPHPTARLQPPSVTERQAPSPVHRPVASGPSPGPAGLRLQASRQLHATSAATSTRAGHRVMLRYNAGATRIKVRSGATLLAPLKEQRSTVPGLDPIRRSQPVHETGSSPRRGFERNRRRGGRLPLGHVSDGPRPVIVASRSSHRPVFASTHIGSTKY